MNPKTQTFLHRPTETFPLIPSQQAADLLTKAEKLLQGTFSPSTPARVRNELLKQEATSSSAIEDEHSNMAIRRNHAALLKFTKEPLSQASLFKAHHTIMTGNPQAMPGAYRTFNVEVGSHRPPRWESLPDYMEEFFEFAQTPGVNPIVHAAWAHIHFETIHPFGDGNGRTGRAIINHILNAPVPLSNYILNNRTDYYRLLGDAEWEPYLTWITNGIIEQCEAMQPT